MKDKIQKSADFSLSTPLGVKIAQIQDQIESLRALLQTYLASDMDIDEMDYNEVVNYAIADVNDQNIFIGHWKDYAYLRGQLSGILTARDEILKMIDEIMEKERKEMNEKSNYHYFEELKEKIE